MPVYLDHAATTPLRPEARDAWVEATDAVGNASSIHGFGQAARRLLEEARERLAAVLECDPIEIVLTSGGTESVNLALKGLWWGR
ncbi:aminotransferase class V-fold PLP-dependent enzyme, partial [Microbacterium sp. 2FI]|uniref:aminotransferase class V-fold PLP-dependent enzyme n=1 Tax=Microbacterium sp. 2FI TaxID=2502193 RepID=UPI0010FA1B53